MYTYLPRLPALINARFRAVGRDRMLITVVALAGLGAVCLAIGQL